MANKPSDFRPSETDEALSDPHLTGDAASQDEGGPSNPDSESGVSVQGTTGGSGDRDAAIQQIAELQDRLLRSQAELENYRRRVQREMQDERRYANQPLLVDLLPVLDNMERAIDAAQQTTDGAGLLTGFKMVHHLLLSTLEKHNCTRVPAAEQVFDPTLHEAIAQMPNAEIEAGKVAVVSQHGYQLHGRVIRPAQVVISTGPPE